MKIINSIMLNDVAHLLREIESHAPNVADGDKVGLDLRAGRRACLVASTHRPETKDRLPMVPTVCVGRISYNGDHRRGDGDANHIILQGLLQPRADGPPESSRTPDHVPQENQKCAKTQADPEAGFAAPPASFFRPSPIIRSGQLLLAR